MAPKAKRAALIGFDCLVPKRLQKLLKEGGLDNFRRFIKEGSYISEGFNLPTVTPPSWATICTGAYPRTHGVEDYYYYHEGRPLDHKYTTQAFGSDILTAQIITLPSTTISVTGFLPKTTKSFSFKLIFIPLLDLIYQ